MIPAMAGSTDEALQVLDQSYKDILIQAGRHFRVIAKDGPDALVGTHSGIQAKTSDLLSKYHLALNEIESEIIQAKSVLRRDLENLRAARVPTPAPVAAPVINPPPRLVVPPTPMIELPSTAAHSRNLNPSDGTIQPSGKETKTVAPFPDMGMGMSVDVVDLTAGERKPSPRVQAVPGKPVARPAPPSNMKPSPKPIHKPTPPAKVTPVPPPQIPRLQAYQSPNISTQPKPQPIIPPPKATQSSQPVQQAQPTKKPQDSATDGTLVIQSTRLGDRATAGVGNSELNFTDMEFSLAPPPNSEPQGAPPAPMPEFDLATFAPQGGDTNATTGNTGNTGNINPARSSNVSSNMDDLFNLGDENGGGNNMFDLEAPEANDSTFDDMMYFGSNDTDMARFNDEYFGL
ncbi:hypothetical protein SAMD00023353_1201010 [Rosellinia necatrix]|uniref:Uncharacterized protein n=1 Tax=Rosellinia necatrix TaxID=77044 RepID=A0A1W2TLJ3_ROSNE|nr:hypothetical protein SAMD00023353_1201010 [Rosellinia necatrix]